MTSFFDKQRSRVTGTHLDPETATATDSSADLSVREQASQTMDTASVLDLTYTADKMAAVVRELTKELECPVSHHLFSHPVFLAESGHVFEEKTLNNCLSFKRMCPVTRIPASGFKPAYIVSNVIGVLTKHFPELINEQYDAQHKPIPYRNVIDLCLAGQFREAESAVCDHKFKMREYAVGVPGDDVLAALSECIVKGHLKLSTFLLDSMRRNVGASLSSNGRGILRVVCGAVYERLNNEGSNGSAWRTEDRQNIDRALQMIQYSFDILRIHRRRVIRGSVDEECFSSDILADTAARVFAGTDAVGENVTEDPLVFAVAYLDSSVTETIVHHLLKVKLLIPKPETLRVAMFGKFPNAHTNFVWKKLFLQDPGIAIEMLGLPVPMTAQRHHPGLAAMTTSPRTCDDNEEEYPPNKDVVEELLIQTPVLFATVADALLETGMVTVLGAPRRSTNCFLTHTLCASGLQERGHVVLLSMLLEDSYVGANQTVGTGQFAAGAGPPGPLPRGIRLGDTALHVLARNKKSLLALFRVFLTNHNVQKYTFNSENDTFIHILLRERHPKLREILTMLVVQQETENASAVSPNRISMEEDEVENGANNQQIANLNNDNCNALGSDGKTCLELAADTIHSRCIFDAVLKLVSDTELQSISTEGLGIVSRMASAGCSSIAKYKSVFARIHVSSEERARARMEGKRVGLRSNVLSFLSPTPTQTPGTTSSDANHSFNGQGFHLVKK